MAKVIRLTESDLALIVKRVINEQENVDGESNDQQMRGDINKVMDFAYEMIGQMAPEGPRNRRQYMSAINQLESEFNYAIRNLKGNLGESRIAKQSIQEQSDDDAGVVVDATKIAAEDMKCFEAISAEEAKKVGMNHGRKYKVKKKGCMTKTKYKGPKVKYGGSNWP